MATFTIHVQLPEEHGTTHCVDVAATDTVKIVLEKVAGELGLHVGDVVLLHDGVALHHLEERVTGTTLGEGSEVVVELSRRAVSRRMIQEMGLEVGVRHLKEVVRSNPGKADEGKAMVARLMLDADEDMDAEEVAHEAAAQGLLETLKVLSAGYLDSRYMGFSSLLHSAVRSSHLPTVQYLVEAGVDTAIPDIWGDTALDNALSCECHSIVSYLESQHAPKFRPPAPLGRVEH